MQHQVPPLRSQRRPAGDRIKHAVVLACLALLPFAAAPANALDAFDVLLTSRHTPATPAQPVLQSARPCTFDALPEPLMLQDAVERALCGNPKTREAWASIKVQAAEVGVKRAAYLPTMTGSWQGVRDDSVTDVTGHPTLSSSQRATIRTESVSLNWVLFDFGARGAALDNAKALLEAATASHEAALQEVFAQVSKDYYAAQAAQGNVTAAREIERTADDTVTASTARVDKGVAPISDELQARTSLAQAVYNRAKAEGELQAALGTLAADMDMRPDTPMALPAVDRGVAADAQFKESIAELIDEARRTHPSVRAAQAQLDAATAKERESLAEGLPSLSLVAKYTRNNQPASLGLGVPQYPATGHDWYVGVQLTIPFFEGFGRVYTVREARAQVDLERYRVDEAQLQAGLDVWTAYQAVQTATANVANSATLLDLAQRAYVAAQHRYTAGVGALLELLSTQSSLATAKEERVRALTDWRASRLQLASKLGTLGMWQVAGY
ncbi:TolC family protein [Trinickia sp. NRRL B-1857]|uniref:TolC family protein n=1 Tax=Trinickia sp. NRRL B-1857 TaxID=3162879 RepID=UPI003D293B4F